MADLATDPWIGKYVIVRTRDAGVHAGTLKSREGRACELTKSRRLWRWRVKDNAGITLTEVALYGLDRRDTKVSATIDLILTENCEIIAATPEAQASIEGFPVYVPR